MYLLLRESNPSQPQLKEKSSLKWLMRANFMLCNCQTIGWILDNPRTILLDKLFILNALPINKIAVLLKAKT